MESGVEEVELFAVTLDMETLVTYSGEGRCRQVRLECADDDDPGLWRVNVKEPLKIWAVNRGWAVTSEFRDELWINR